MVCLHGVPASCFLYRKVLRELAARGLRGVAFDLPGLGLADRPAFLKIMRGFERTRAKRDLYRRVLGDGRYPVQVVWGANDPALKLATEGEAVRRAAGADKIHTVPAKHFLQEDQAPAVAEHIARIVAA